MTSAFWHWRNIMFSLVYHLIYSAMLFGPPTPPCPVIVVPPEVRSDLVFILSECSREDSIFVLQMDAAFNMYDKSYWGDRLVSCHTLDCFKTAIEEYRKKYLSGKRNPKKPLGTWEEWEEALQRCEEIFGTPIWTLPRHVGWELAFNRKEGYGFGAPTYQWKDLNPNGDSATEDWYTLYWGSLNHEEVIRSDSVNGIPFTIIPADSLKTPDWIVMYPYVDLPIFPREDGTYFMLACVSVTGDMLSSRTLSLGTISSEIDVRKKKQLVAHDSAVGGLESIRPYLHRIDQLSSRVVSLFLKAGSITAGRHDVRIDITGAPRNGGRYKKSVTFPSIYSSHGMSDLILVKDCGMDGDGLIEDLIWYGEPVCVDPFRIFIKGDPRHNTLQPYLEYFPPFDSLVEHAKFTVSLEPIGFEKADAYTLPITSWEDMQGNSHIIKVPENRREYSDEGSSSRSIPIYSEDVSVHSPMAFSAKVNLPEGIPAGEYWLRVTFDSSFKPSIKLPSHDFTAGTEVKITIVE